MAYGRLPVSTRLTLHARYADAGVGPTDHVARAFHLWEAAKPPDAEWVWEEAAQLTSLRARAFDLQVAAGKELEARNQYELAEEAYHRAAVLAADPQKRAEAQAEQGGAMARQGRGDDSWATRLAAIELYRQAGVEPPSRLYADMLEIATMNWGYFHELPKDADVTRLLTEGLARAEAEGDDVSRVRLIMERASLTGDPVGTDEILGFIDGPDGLRFADAAHRTAQILKQNGQLARSVQLYKRVFDDLLPRGGVFNEPEAMTWYGLAAFYEGDLELAVSLAERGLADVAKGRSVHTQSHVFGIRSLVAFGRGDWPALVKSAIDLETLVARNPDVPFCLVGAAGVGYGGVGRIMADTATTDLEADVARMVDEDLKLVQAASILLPKAMLGDVDAFERGLGAYAPGLRLYDRMAAWDVAHLMPAIAACILERWEMLDGPLARLDFCAAGGSRLASAAALAVREERAAAEGGGAPKHVDLRTLGYIGISELLHYRAQPPLEEAA